MRTDASRFRELWYFVKFIHNGFIAVSLGEPFFWPPTGTLNLDSR